MRHAKLILVAAAVVASNAGSSSVQAQANSPSFGIVAGGTKALGNLSDGVDLGYHGGVLAQFTSPETPLGVRLDGVYNRLPLKEGDANFNILAITLDGMYTIPMDKGSQVIPYLIGGLGFYRMTLTCSGCGDGGSIRKGGLNGGAGLSFPLSGFSAFVEARYHHVFIEHGSTKFLPVSVGLVFHP